MLNPGGARLRPYWTIACARLVAGRVATAIELIRIRSTILVRQGARAAGARRGTYGTAGAVPHQPPRLGGVTTRVMR